MNKVDHLNPNQYTYQSVFYDHHLVTVRIYRTKDFIYRNFFIDEDNALACLLNDNEELIIDAFNEKQFSYFYRLSCDLKNKQGDDFLIISILEKKYTIKFLYGATRSYFEIINQKVYLHLKNRNLCKKYVREIKVALASDYIKKRVRYWARTMHAKIKGINYKEMFNTIAYYRHSNQTITFSYQSLSFDKISFDSLIIHEIAHYFEQNHQKKFWEIVKTYDKHFKAKRLRLAQF